MFHQIMRSRGWSLGIVAVLLAQVGCVHFGHSIVPPKPEEVAPALTVGQCQKNKVYIFFVQGLDPLDCSNLGGLHDYVQSLGFIKTYYGQPFHTYHFAREVRRLRKQDAEARIVLVGFSHGANMVRDLAVSAGEAGIQIDLVLYIDGAECGDKQLDRPCNVQRVVNVLSRNRGNDQIVQEAENHRYQDTHHLGTVTDRRTFLLVANELGEVARRVPIRYRPHPADAVPGPIQIPSQLPPPRELTQKSDGWDFLLPDPYTQQAPGEKPIEQAMKANPATTAHRQ